MHACIIILAAEKNDNEILETYHNGAYGSRQPDEWSCCKHKGREQMGCIYTTDNKPVPDSAYLPSAIVISRPNSSLTEPRDFDYK